MPITDEYPGQPTSQPANQPKPPYHQQPEPDYGPNIIMPNNMAGSNVVLNWMRDNDYDFNLVPSIQEGYQEVLRPNRSYWENPYRVARYHNFIRTAPPGWKPPSWLDVPAVEAAYKYMGEQNKTSDWTKWKYLADSDPASQWLRDMQMPPPEFLFTKEAEELRAQMKIGTWDDLYPYQKTYMTLFSPQPLNAEDATGRPVESQIFANLTRSGLQGAIGAGLGAGIAKVAVAAGLASGTATGVIPAVMAATFAIGSMYQLSTGKKLPIIGDMLEWLGIAGKPAEYTEQAIGVAEQAIDNDLKEILDNFGPAWQASGANYETNTRNLFMNAWTGAAGMMGAEGAQISQPGEVYRWELGLPDPQRLPEGYTTGVDALNDIREQIIAGGDPIAVVEDYKQQFGIQGISNDFILQNIFDPLNYLPSVSQATGRAIAKNAGDVNWLAAIEPVKASNVIVDGLPMPLNMLATWVSGGRLQGSAGILDGVLRYKTFVETGQFPGYKGAPDDFIPPKDYSQAQKTLGDLTDEGLPKYYVPDEPGSGLKGLFKRWINLTPRSKAELSYSNIADHMDVLMSMSGDDVGLAVKILKSAGQVNTTTTAQAFEQIVNPEGFSGSILEPQNFITPIGAALADGLRKIEADGLIDEFYNTRWITSQDRRAALYKAAELLEIKPGEVLEQLANDIDLAGALKARATEAGIKDFDGLDNAALKETLGVFMGDDPLPIHPDQFKAELANAVKEKLAFNIAARFGLKDDSKFMRFTKVLKDMQSLLVLGFNPAYMVNNFINNIITRTADGVFGAMTRSQITSLMSRLEIDPTRADMGFKDSSMAKETFGITNDGKVTRVSDVVKAEQDLIRAAQTKVRDLKNKVGIFSNLSAVIERSESQQAYVSALRHIQSNLWRRDVAIRPLPDRIRQALGEDVANRLYEIAEKSWNGKEIDANFYGKGYPTVTEMLGRILDAFEGRNQNLIGNQDMYREILTATGIIDELDTRLKNAQSVIDIDNAFAEVGDTIEGKIQQMLAQEIDTRVEHIKNKVTAEGVTAAIAEFTDVELDFMRTWITHFNELEDLFSRKGSMDNKEFSRQYYMLRKRDDARFTRLFDWEGATTKGILEALGFTKDDPSVKTILDSHDSTARNWRDFYKYRDERFKALVEDTYADDSSFKIALDEARKDVQEMADAAYGIEQSNYRKMNEAFISLSRDKELARTWREEVTAIRQDMIKGMQDFRQSLADNPPATMMERNYRWSQFINKEYAPRIVALKSREALAQNMYDSAHGKTPDLYDYIVENPIDGNVPEALRAKIQQEASYMLQELGEGQGPRKIWIPTQPGEGYSSDNVSNQFRDIISEPTTNVSWYRNLFDNNNSVNRSTVTNALKYLAEGSTRGNSFTPQLKELILKRLMGIEPKGFDGGAVKRGATSADNFTEADPEALWLLGSKDAAAWYLDDMINSKGDYTPENIELYFRDPALRDRIYDYWANDFLPKQTVRELFENTGRFSEQHINGIVSLYDIRAERWAAETGNPPREWWSKYMSEIEYADRPEDVLYELFQTGETSTTWHFSQLQRTIEGMPNRMPVEQFQNWLKGKVKAEELRDTGFDQWIKDQPGMVEKSNALDYLNNQAVRIDRSSNINVPELIISKPYVGEGNTKNIIGRIIFDEVIDGNGKNTLAVLQIELEDNVQSIRSLVRYASEHGYDRLLIPTGDKLPVEILSEIISKSKINADEIVTDGGVAYNFDITPEMRKSVMEGLPLYQVEQDILNLGRKYGIATATIDGKPNNAQLLNTINKYAETKYETLDEVPIDIAHRALEKRRIEQGGDPVSNPLYKGSTSFDEDGAAIMRIYQAADVSTLVHESGHMFRRQLSGDDLEVIAKWTGLESADELNRLQQKFDNKTITEEERIRYVESEERFAEGFEKYIRAEHKNLPQRIQAVFMQFAQWLMKVFRSLSDKYDMDINATVDVNGQQVRVKDVLDRMFMDTEGRESLGTVPEPMPQSKPLSEIADMYLYRLMDTAKDVYKRNYQGYKPFSVDGVPAQYRSDVVKWINSLKSDLASTKIASMKYAEAKRDQALINYGRRTGFDEMLSVPFPYIFWYTKSMMNWSMRMLDNPKIFATYARFKEMQEKMQREGIPARMADKIRINAPYLPDWMGGGLWQDPMKQIFPFSQMMDPVDRAAHIENSLKYETFDVLNEMAKQGKITEDQAKLAREIQSGELWDAAQSEAANRLGTFSPMSLASIMASPAMYLDVPWKLAAGTPEKIQPTPFLKTTQAVETLTQNTPLQGIGRIIGGIGGLEVGLRRKAMTPAVAMFGEYGDYYVDRQLSNMVADGVLSIDEARLAMVERDGPDYDAAVNRVREEVALRVPGAAAVMAVKNGANIPQFAASVFHSLNPSGILPTGELEYLEKKDDYMYAWDMYNKGYKDQINQFFEDNPEFEARIAIKDDPDERLQNFLVSEIWDRYMSLPDADKQLVRDQLGRDFQDVFMQERAYDAIPVDRLAMWANAIGGAVPQVTGVEGINEMPGVEMWSGDAANAYQLYTDTRDQMFPNWYAIEQGYFDQPKARRGSYLSSHPELKEYWDWKDTFRQMHPEIEPIMAYKSAQFEQENAMMNMQMLESMPEELTMQLQSYALMGTNMGPGAWEALRYVWERSGQPYGNLKTWVDEVIVESVR